MLHIIAVFEQILSDTVTKHLILPPSILIMLKFVISGSYV